MTIDWGVGRYENTAERLLPAAREVIAVAAPQPDERVADVGCGTGNAALLAAERGASVVGVDPAARLLRVARSRAAQAGLDVRFVEGEAAALPLPDRSIDLVVSVFAVIFASDPTAALAELARVAAPGGRIVLSAWIPDGPLSRMNRLAREAVSEALGAAAAPPALAWHDADAVGRAVAAYGFQVTATERALAFTAESAAALIDDDTANHPVAISSMRVLEASGRSESLRRQMVAVLEEGNEDPAGFRATSRYVILSLTRD